MIFVYFRQAITVMLSAADKFQFRTHTKPQGMETKHISYLWLGEHFKKIEISAFKLGNLEAKLNTSLAQICEWLLLSRGMPYSCMPLK